MPPLQGDSLSAHCEFQRTSHAALKRNESGKLSSFAVTKSLSVDGLTQRIPRHHNGDNVHPLLLPDILIPILSYVQNARHTLSDSSNSDLSCTPDVTLRQLYTCALVCRTWNTFATKMLWSELRLDNFYTFRRLLRTFAPKSRWLELRERGQDRLEAEWRKGGVFSVIGAVLGGVWEMSEKLVSRVATDGESGVTTIVKDWNLLPEMWRSSLLTPEYTHLYGGMVTKLVCYKLYDITDDHMIPILRQCHSLTHLELHACHLLTNATIVTAAHHCPHLSHVITPHVPKITDTSLSELTRFCHKTLVHLDLRFCSLITDKGLCPLFRRCTRLRHINLGRREDGNCVTDRSLYVLARNCKSLVELGLTGCRVTDEAIGLVVEECGESLRTLEVNYCPITDKSLTRIKSQCKKLAVLEVKGCVLISDMRPLRTLIQQRVRVELCQDLRTRMVEAGLAGMFSATSLMGAM
ncbi:hypothetical protein SpCBS45565_g04197 [Spizellomyces sp. 'palustris']|nr:hypothetical protein SpCBS45565_g04197 [Spizellomyces sp. 'palustris']